MSAHLMQAGFGLANYLHTALSPAPLRSDDVPTGFDQPSDRQCRPPAMIHSLIDSGRFYFRLTHQNALNNIICVFMPVGKVRHLVPDLYIPVVSVYTFLLLRSIYVSTLRKGPYHLHEALTRTFTRMGLIFAAEFILFSGLLYATQPSVAPLDGISQQSQPGTNNPQMNTLGQPNNAFGGYMDGTIGNSTGTYSNNPFDHSGNKQSQHGVASYNSPPFGQMAPSNGNMNEFRGATKYFGEDMTLPLSGRSAIRIAQKLFIIAYKYILLNCYILIAFIAPIRAAMLPMAVYVCLCSLLFSLRMIVSLHPKEGNKQNPLIFVFPFLQPLFCYFLIPA
uniref:Uncharacterized protein n=1 Tax=Babesia bovis TaxID=5865 RepID=S6BIK9_BABBO|nr:hypothetical protein [Babesia bovis]